MYRDIQRAISPYFVSQYTQIFTISCIVTHAKYLREGNFRAFLRFFAFFVKIFAKKFGGKEKMSTFAIPNGKNGSPNAEIAQLVEHNLAKVGVASSSLVFRSKTKEVSRNADLLFETKSQTY